jgi:cell division protein FtsB
MLEFQEKKRLKKRIYSYGSIILLCLLAFFLAKAAFGVYKKAAISRENKERAARELEKLETRETMLQNEIARLSSAEGIEEEIRGRFNVVKEGEQIAIIVENEQNTATSTTQKGRGFWSRLRGIFN